MIYDGNSQYTWHNIFVVVIFVDVCPLVIPEFSSNDDETCNHNIDATQQNDGFLQILSNSEVSFVVY